MSKHLGNILEPIPLMDAHGADAVRWFMAAGGSPWQARRVGHAAIQEVVRKTLLTYWNTVAFQSLYAAAPRLGARRRRAPADRRPPGAGPLGAVRGAPAGARGRRRPARRTTPSAPAGCSRPTSTTCPTGTCAARRRRFWAGDPAALRDAARVPLRRDAAAGPAHAVRHRAGLAGPVRRSTSDELPDSVHLPAWPEVDGSLVDDELADQMALVRRLVELGRAARAESGVKTRQPLGRALVGGGRLGRAARGAARAGRRGAQRRVARRRSATAGGDLVDISVEGQFPCAGQAIRPAHPGGRRRGRRSRRGRAGGGAASTGTATVDVDGEPVEVTPDEVIVTETPRSGWAVAADAGETVALDLEITPELRRAGLAREAVRMIQEARKTSGFDVSDRIALRWAADGEIAEALARARVDGGRRGARDPSVERARRRPTSARTAFADAGSGAAGHARTRLRQR